MSIAKDFFVFCLLAARRGVTPPDWSWGDFLPVAAKFCHFAFEKSDAQDRWGSENVFEAMMVRRGVGTGCRTAPGPARVSNTRV